MFLSREFQPSTGGLGMNMVDRSAVFDEAGYSLFGPAALNSAAPDEGTSHLLEQAATGPGLGRGGAPGAATPHAPTKKQS